MITAGLLSRSEDGQLSGRPDHLCETRACGSHP